MFGSFEGDGFHHLRLYVEKTQEVLRSCSALYLCDHVCEKIITNSLYKGIAAVLCRALKLNEGATIDKLMCCLHIHRNSY